MKTSKNTEQLKPGKMKKYKIIFGDIDFYDTKAVIINTHKVVEIEAKSDDDIDLLADTMMSELGFNSYLIPSIYGYTIVNSSNNNI